MTEKPVTVIFTIDAYDFIVAAELAAGNVDDTGMTPTERERLSQEFDRRYSAPRRNAAVEHPVTTARYPSNEETAE